jgi:phosphopantothenoylcysteine decarboxylase/phosphopantothenate--cysteine ligase
MAAAVADFRPDSAADAKLKKDGRAELGLRLVPTADILTALAQSRRPGQTLVGFAAEHGEQTAVGYGRDKLERKGLDAVVVNDISRSDIGFEAPDNEVTIVTADADERVARSEKAEVARAVLAAVDRLRARATA